MPFTCSGTLTRLPVQHHENLGLDTTPYFCVTNQKPTLHEIDSTGKEWTLQDLRVAEAAAFRDRYHRLAPDLRARIARDGESARQLADIWFPTPLDADQKLPPKPDFLALSKAEQKAIVDEHNAAIAARAREVAAMIHSVAPAATVDPASFAFHGEGPLLWVDALPAELRAIGDQPGILDVGLSLRPEDDTLESSAWFSAEQFDVLGYVGDTGDGVTVADIEGSPGAYDTRYLGLAAGVCSPNYGGYSYNCFCQAAAGTATGPTHQEHMLSVIKNTWPTLPGGAAHGARVVVGNGNGLCPPSH